MSKFSKQHYEIVAGVIKGRANATHSGELKNWAEEFANVFQADNQNFKRNRFLDACGVQ